MRAIENLEEGCYYHLYNRGINGEDIFKSPKDYRRFIDNFQEYSIEVLDTFAYCLLINHFHALVFVKKDIVVPRKESKGMGKFS